MGVHVLTNKEDSQAVLYDSVTDRPLLLRVFGDQSFFGGAEEAAEDFLAWLRDEKGVDPRELGPLSADEAQKEWVEHVRARGREAGVEI